MNPQQWMKSRATNLLKRHSEDAGIRSSMVKMGVKLMRMDSLLARNRSATFDEKPKLPATSERRSTDQGTPARTGAEALSSSQADLQSHQVIQSDAVQQKSTKFIFTPSHLPIATAPSPSPSHGGGFGRSLQSMPEHGQCSADAGAQLSAGYPGGQWPSVASASVSAATAPPPVHAGGNWAVPPSFPPPQSQPQQERPPPQVTFSNTLPFCSTWREKGGSLRLFRAKN
jgi:hypothetical protein